MFFVYICVHKKYIIWYLYYDSPKFNQLVSDLCSERKGEKYMLKSFLDYIYNFINYKFSSKTKIM